LTSLTPALSPREGEKRSQLFGAALTDFWFKTHTFYRRSQWLFPLLGERVGEEKFSNY